MDLQILLDCFLEFVRIADSETLWLNSRTGVKNHSISGRHRADPPLSPPASPAPPAPLSNPLSEARTFRGENLLVTPSLIC